MLPAGEFMMGSPPSESWTSQRERPQRKVTIQRPFAVGKFEVTFAEWDACVAEGGCKHRPERSGLGARQTAGHQRVVARREGVRGVAFAQDGQELPATERSRVGVRGTGGHHDAVRVRRHDQQEPGAVPRPSKTVEVGSFPANRFGLHDLHGNVWEWVEDNWHPNYQGAPIDGSVWPGGDVSLRVLRGGSWVGYDPRRPPLGRPLQGTDPTTATYASASELPERSNTLSLYILTS